MRPPANHTSATLRLALAVLMVTLGAVGCSDDDDGALDANVGDDVTTTSSPAGQGSPSTAVTTPPADTIVPGVPTTQPRPGDPPATSPPPPDRRDTGGGDPAYDASGGPGSYADTLLRPQPATRIVLELLVQEGADPRSGTVDHLRSVLEAVSGKPVTVRAGTVDSSRTSWRSGDVVAAADAAGMTPQGGGTAVIRLLYLRGSFADHESALGVALRGSVAAIFHDKVRSASSPVVPASSIEDAVSVHEVGHLLGLVDLFLDTNRSDPDHPHHSPNRGSVMYYAVEIDLVGQLLNGPPPNQFDDADLADLRRIRSG